MLKKDVLAHYKTPKAVAERLGVTVQAISQWGELIPPAQARRLHELTLGSLRYDPRDYEGRYPAYRFLPPPLDAA